MDTKVHREPILEMRGIVKEFPGVRALNNVSFDILPGEVHALVGENGAGKSTLMNILSGIYPYGSFTGDILFQGSHVRFHSPRDSAVAGITIIHQELALVKNLSVAENIFLGSEPSRFGFVDHLAMITHAQDLCSTYGFGMDVTAETGTLGIAQQQLVEILKALKNNSTILVLDEPTAALTEKETEILFSIIRGLAKRGTSMVYISHKLDEVFSISDRITVLRDGETVQTGVTHEWTKQKLISAMVGRPLHDMIPKTQTCIGNVVLEIRNLSVSDMFDEEKYILQDISLDVHEGELVCIAGLMGSGRSEVLHSLFGDPPGIQTSGEVRISGNTVTISSPTDAIDNGLALIPEDRKNQGLVVMLSVADNLSMVHLNKFSRAGSIDNARWQGDCNTLAELFTIKGTSLDSPVESLSGGNQQKIVIAKWFLKKPRIVLMDEPTRGIDVGSKFEIYKIIDELKSHGAAVIVVSSELPEVIGLADRVVVMKEGRKKGELSGDHITQENIMEMAT